MSRQQNSNLDLLLLVVNQLGDLADNMVFLGGCATGLLITDSAAPPIRVTRDVDAIVQVYSYTEYQKLSKLLRKKGFNEDKSDNAPICRWVGDNVILDIIPTDSKILGFGNKWYDLAVKNAVTMQLENQIHLNVVSAPYFLITKLEAFDGRGQGDYVLSHDIEDIVAVLDGRRELIEEIKNADNLVADELAKRFSLLSKNTDFKYALAGHMPQDILSQERTPMILEKIRLIVELKN